MNVLSMMDKVIECVDDDALMSYWIEYSVTFRYPCLADSKGKFESHVVSVGRNQKNKIACAIEEALNLADSKNETDADVWSIVRLEATK